jgi:hypothetical protein
MSFQFKFFFYLNLFFPCVFYELPKRKFPFILSLAPPPPKKKKKQKIAKKPGKKKKEFKVKVISKCSLQFFWFPWLVPYLTPYLAVPSNWERCCSLSLFLSSLALFLSSQVYFFNPGVN